MGEIILILLYIAAVAICLWLFLNLTAGSLMVGAIGGIVVGLFYGFKNYFSSLIEEIKLRK